MHSSEDCRVACGLQGDEWNCAHEVKVLKYQFFELFADLGCLAFN